MKYTPNPTSIVQDMLDSIGMSVIDELFADIPDEIKLSRELNLGTGMTEITLRNHLKSMAGKNTSVEDVPCFLGAGAYDHYIPVAMEQLLQRSEFYTAYTPYQPEISQGILQSIFEYQSFICELTGMDVSNASVYDGGSAVAEACALACEVTKRSRVIVSGTVHPEFREVINTYALSGRMEVVLAEEEDGITRVDHLLQLIDKQTAAVVIQQPNFYGNLEDLGEIEQAIHQHKGLLIMAVDPISLAILKSPAEWGADIAVGEGQALGNPLSFGGPYLGFMAVSKKYMRKIPGRIVGQSVDSDGKRAFVLTLQAREQHIRREKASSNICSNQALNALAASMYLTFVGPNGLKEIAVRSHQLAFYARGQMKQKGLNLKWDRPFFREFVLSCENPAEMNQRLLQNGIIGGYELPDGLLLAFTEKRTRNEIDKLVAVLGGEGCA
ncbi:MAG: aminomethyl-transferring glycine dehydrogenase subunit GcvPA [Bacillota bacterium]|nr:aminomethyl-transferring glycine dehydrogenase subunit GcvPA [Bacillota bacterium]